MPFDFWLDDLAYTPSDGGAGGGGGTGNGFVLSEDQFEAMFPNRAPLYTYQGLTQAAQKFPAFAAEGSDEIRKRELAAFFGNVAHETGRLSATVEAAPQSNYCQGNCAPGQTYVGRGPLQLTWSYNYEACGQAIGRDLLNNPDLVATDPVVTWEAALWFWMSNTGGTNGTAHNAIVSGLGFGQTIDIINGGVECNGGNPAAVTSRGDQYTLFCNFLAVATGESLGC